MSIQSMMKTYDVYENKQIEDTWGAVTTEEVRVGTAEVAINYASATLISNDTRFSEITHTGLTMSKALKQGQVLVLGNNRYVILLPPNDMTRYTQLYLKAVG